MTVELRLDRVEAELAIELPAHMRAFARAYARGEVLPPAPAALHRRVTLATARAALAHPILADRGLALLRLVAPIAIDDDAGVAAAHLAEPTWDALATLARARDAAATALFGRRTIDVLHRLHGAGSSTSSTPDTPVVADPSAPGLPPPVIAWSDPDGIAIDSHAISQTWDSLRAHHGVAGAVRFERAVSARPRCFVVQPRGEVVVVIPSLIETPAARFSVLHELGHVLAALALPAGTPRSVDEAAAAYVARSMERPGDRGGIWYSPAAGQARTRRRQVAALLDRIERALPAAPATLPSELPPWALWHDPGAQAAYLAAELLSDDIERVIGAAPVPGALVEALVARRETIDRRDSLL